MGFKQSFNRAIWNIFIGWMRLARFAVSKKCWERILRLFCFWNISGQFYNWNHQFHFISHQHKISVSFFKFASPIICKPYRYDLWNLIGAYLVPMYKQFSFYSIFLLLLFITLLFFSSRVEFQPELHFRCHQILQLNLFQKHLFLHQLTHNITKDFSLNYKFSTWKLQAQNMLRT